MPPCHGESRAAFYIALPTRVCCSILISSRSSIRSSPGLSCMMQLNIETHSHEFLHLLPFHARLKLSLLRRGESIESLARHQRRSERGPHPSILNISAGMLILTRVPMRSRSRDRSRHKVLKAKNCWQLHKYLVIASSLEVEDSSE